MKELRARAGISCAFWRSSRDAMLRCTTRRSASTASGGQRSSAPATASKNVQIIPARALSLVLLTTTSFLFSCLTHAADAPYPQRVIRLVVPFPAGGPTDIVARPLAREMSEILGQVVMVDNRGGAGGTIGADNVAKSAADGYVLFLGTVGTQAINSSIYKKLPYNPLSDFTPIALVGFAPVAIVAHPGEALDSVASLIARSKDKSNAVFLNFGSAGNGSPGHLAGERFKAQTGAAIAHVPYKGSAPAIQDLIGGQINLMFDPVQSVLPHIKNGRIKAIAVSSKQRLSVLPNVPTVAESGYPDFEMTAWWGLLAPANLPKPILEKLAAAVQKTIQSDSFKRLRDLGIEPSYMNPVTFGKFIEAESMKWSKVVRESGAAVD
jgi:tripartite-type tricarboxylate transporter receptor subunit TctC